MSDKFTMQDAQNLIACAQAAPLQNFHAAMELNALIQRAQLFFAETLVPKAVQTGQDAGKKRKEPKATPQDPDPAV